jgi:glycosyltransferase involved in cell wall biosynthesis
MIRAFRAVGDDVRVIGPVGEPGSERGVRKGGRLGRIKAATPRLLFECLELAYGVYAFIATLIAIVRLRPDFIYDRYIAFNFGVVAAARRARVPVLLEVNAPLALERDVEADERLVLRRAAYAMEKWICSKATWTIVVSTPLKEYLGHIGAPTDKCVVMPNGADPGRFSPRAPDPALRKRLGVADDAFVIGFTGVVRAWHGLDLLVEAMAAVVRECPSARLLIVGDGPYRGPLEELARRVGVAHTVIVTGRVSHDDVPDHIALFDVAVSPRSTFYASPMKAIEYMALGRPVVVPRAQNFLDFVDDDRTGVTFAENDASDMARVLLELWRSPERRERIGAAAREKVEHRLNWQWNAQECHRLVQSEVTADAAVVE